MVRSHGSVIIDFFSFPSLMHLLLKIRIFPKATDYVLFCLIITTFPLFFYVHKDTIFKDGRRERIRLFSRKWDALKSKLST